MLAATFVIHGARAVRDPDALVPVAKPFTDRFMPTLKQYVPDQVAERIPESPRALVRLNGAVQVLGGLALATGRFRRAGAIALALTLVPTTLAGHAFWDEDDEAQRSAHKVHFLKNVGLGGGLVLAAVDTEGRPGVGWRVRHGAQHAAKASRRVTRTARREARLAARAARAELPFH